MVCLPWRVPNSTCSRFSPNARTNVEWVSLWSECRAVWRAGKSEVQEKEELPWPLPNLARRQREDQPPPTSADSRSRRRRYDSQCEPLLAKVDVSQLLGDGQCDECDAGGPLAYWPMTDDVRFPAADQTAIKDTHGIDWLVVGGEPAQRRGHRIQLVPFATRSTCHAGVPLFFKQWGGGHRMPRHKYADSTIKMDDGTYLRFVGKKRAGRTLDGRTWEEYPASTAPAALRHRATAAIAPLARRPVGSKPWTRGWSRSASGG